MPTKKTARKSSKPANSSDAVDAQLERYRSMRDFSVTAEPAGKAKATKLPELPFCIQKHAASHLHYDFRLGWNGVLKSWACAKGPSYNVKDRRLAVQVEDHPIEYGGFEGIIPAGQYGGGTVMLWDQGTWEPQPEYPDVDAGLHDGHLKFLMHGTKMKGKWALIRMAPRPKETKPNWLLIKEHDEFERPPEAEPVTEAEPNSVVTGRSLEQIAANQDHIWNSNRPEKTSPAPAAPKARKPAASALHAADLAKLPKELQLSFLKPQLALETKSPPDTAGWLHELKLDGYRIQGRKDGAKVQMLTRSGLNWTARMTAIAAEVARLPCEACTLDGEVVVLAPDGTSNFADLQAAFQEGARNPLTYFCFDLLHLDGRNPRDLPLIERKKLLADLLLQADPDLLQVSEHLETSGVEMFHRACELHAEGIVSKRATAAYSGTRNSDWLKSKCLHEQEFVIGGYTLPGKGKAGGPGLGALLLGYYDDKKILIYAGRTGTGFTEKFAATLRKRLHALETAKAAFQSMTTDARRGAIWVQPTLVAQVRFATWTADEQVRQAAFLGLREDKAAKDVRRETAAPTPKSAESKSRSAHPADARPAKKPAAEHKTEHPPIRLTHPDKVLDPASRLSKQQLADYYWAVSANMLPHLAERALSLVRVPEGIDHEHFYQKHVTHMLPPGFESVDVPDKKTGKVEKYISLSTREAIASLAQISVLEVHPWGSLADDLERPDRLVIDLDPDEALPWSTLADAAGEVRKRLKLLGLESFLKTTGGKGLHVVIPVVPELEWPAIKTLCHNFVLAMERANPNLYLTKMTKAARTGKIYLDYLRNERGATAVAPWSPRARANVGVAVPLSWPELKLLERPIFNIGNFAEWRARLKKDPWAKMGEVRQQITAEARRSLAIK
jgi:bifunctional non-homologous end joining protein LigD